MASKRNALSFLIPEFDPRLYIGFHFLPTYEDGITIVEIKNAGEELLPIFKEDDDLFRRPPEELEECHCFTTLKRVGKNKVNRKLQDGSDRRFWKNIDKEEVVVNNIVIGFVTKLRLHEDKNTPTEWHILEYRDRKTPDPRRWVLCQIYKREKANDSSNSSGEMNQVRHYEMGERSDTQPDWGATYPHLTGENMNQDQIDGVGQYGYTPPGDVVNNPQQFTSNNTFSNGVIDTFSGFYPSTSQVSSMNQVQIHGVGQYGYTPPGDVVKNPQQFTSNNTFSNGGIDSFNGFYPSTSQVSSMNQVQIDGVGQHGYTPPGDVVNNPQQFTSNNTYSIGGMHTYSGFDSDDWINGYFNADLYK